MQKLAAKILVFTFAASFYGGGSVHAGVPSSECRSKLKAAVSVPHYSESQKRDSDKAKLLLAKTRELNKLSSERLMPQLNPFALAQNQEQVSGIMLRLSHRQSPQGSGVKFETAAGGKSELTYGAQLNEEIIRNYVKKPESIAFDSKLIELLLKDAEQVIYSEDAKRVDLYSVAYGLRRADEYLSRFIIFEMEQKKQEEKQEQKPEKKKEDKKQQQQNQNGKGKSEEQQKKEEKPQAQKKAEAYKPNTKDLQSGSKSQKFNWATFYGAANLFQFQAFNIIKRDSQQPFIAGQIPLLDLNIYEARHATHKMDYNTYGEKELLLSIPAGYFPLEPVDGQSKITRDESGSYFLHTNQERVMIPLKESSHAGSNVELVEFFSRKVGFNENEWPKDIQDKLIKPLKAKGASPLEVSQTIVKYIQDKYFYAEKEASETDPIAALKTEGFQCDMAAYIMVSLLRDVFQIPSRVAGGFRTHHIKRDGKVITELIVSNQGDGHSWIQVLDGSRWVDFDPTPIKKKNQQGEEKQQSEENQQQDESSQENQSQGSQGQQSSKKQNKQVVKTQEELKKKVKEDSKKQSDDVLQNKNQGNDNDAQKQQKTLEDLQKELKIGSLSMNEKQNHDPLIARAKRILLRYILDPTKRKTYAHQTLNYAKSDVLKNLPSDMANFTEEIEKIFKTRQSDFINEELLTLRRTAQTQEVNHTYFKLLAIARQLELCSQTLDLNGKISKPSHIIGLIRGALAELMKLNMADSREMAAVREFMSNLPPFTRNVVKKKFAMGDVGPNAGTKAVAEALKKGQLSDYQLLAMVRSYTDFVLESEPVTEYGKVKIQETDPRFPRGRDLVQIRNPLDIFKSTVISTEPLVDKFENYVRGKLFGFKKKKEAAVPLKYGVTDEMERITILAYDVSGSMAGAPEKFQSALIGAFADNAASDVSASGRQRHKVVLMAFGTKVYEPQFIRDAAEAQKLIANFAKHTANKGDGTDIQGTMLQALSLIADAQRKNGEPLKKANIVIMTDGEAEVNFEAIEQARRAVDTRTKIDIAFVAINGTNAELMKVALNSKKAGIDRGFYKSFEPEVISEYVEKSEKIHLPEAEESYFSQSRPSDLSENFYRTLENAQIQLEQYQTEVEVKSRPINMGQNQMELKSIAEQNVTAENLEDKKKGEAIIRLRSLIYNYSVFADKNLRAAIISDLIENYSNLMGVQLNQIGPFQATSLGHFIDEHLSGKNTSNEK